MSSRSCTVTIQAQSLTYVASSFGALDTCAVITVAGCRGTRIVSNSVEVKSLLLSIRTDAPEHTTNALSSILSLDSGWPCGQTVQQVAGAIEWIQLEGLEVRLAVQDVMEIVGRRVDDVVQVTTTSEDVALREYGPIF